MKKLQLKLVRVAFTSSVTVFLVMGLGLYLALANYNTSQADARTSLIAFNGGEVPDYQTFSVTEFEDTTRYRIRLDDESEYRIRYFIVYLDENGGVKDIRVDHIASIDEESAEDYASEVIFRGRKRGYYQGYRYRLVQEEDSDSSFIVFLDCAESIYAQREILLRIVIITLLFALAVTIVFAAFSRQILEPFERNQRMQKQFITDASHELKTPLAVISANAEVLRYKNGDNEWLDNITSQTQRLSRLIGQLLVLSRMEEVGDAPEKEKLDLSQMAENSVARFREVFGRKGVNFETKIEEGLMIEANRNQMENLCDILIENASKYVDENGQAGVILSAAGGRKIKLEVFNTAEGCENMDCERIFERFYRTDESRSSSTGGHGIGLSIAKRIAEQHKGTISAAAEKGKVTFTVRLPGA
ncbi:MAG: GHKL domain-containing protein [Lachnospiraceae bacterium]|nr:GHKL domain-containing protein [Lachnospiraceae bacterium]